MPPPGSPTPFDSQSSDPFRSGNPSAAHQPFPPGTPPPPPGYQETPPGYAPFTPQNPATGFGQIAGFGARLGAWIVDWILYGLVMAIGLVPGILVIVGAFDDCTRFGTNGEFRCVGDQLRVGSLLTGMAIIGATLLLVAMLYVWALATSGQTWGRKLVGVKVIDERTGGVPGWGKAIGRSAFAWFISAQILYIGYLWMLWDDRKQTLHDKVAGTHVVTV